MWEKIFIFPEEPDFNVVPPLKLCHFPFANGSWRPFCHLSISFVKNKGISCRFKPFEAEPKINKDDILGGNAFTVSFKNPENNRYLKLTFSPDGALLNAPESKFTPTVSAAKKGEDQQGDYFLTGIFLSLSLLKEQLGIEDIKEGSKLLFNAFYSIMENDKGYTPHFASLFDNSDKNTPLERLSDPQNNSIITAVEFY